MYAQPNVTPTPPHDDIQTFMRGDVVVPANYKGNAFTMDETPCENVCEPCEVTYSSPMSECEECTGAPNIQCAPPRCTSEAHCQSQCAPQKSGRGLFSGIFDRFSRGFELDDILLIGLIILLLQNDCERRDETVILLALLLLGGF